MQGVSATYLTSCSRTFLNRIHNQYLVQFMGRLGVITQCSIHHVLFGSVDALPKLSDDLNNEPAPSSPGISTQDDDG